MKKNCKEEFNPDNKVCLECGEDEETLPYYRGCQIEYMRSLITIKRKGEEDDVRHELPEV